MSDDLTDPRLTRLDNADPKATDCVARVNFKLCCRLVVENGNNPALNWAVNYAKAGFNLPGTYECKIQAAYLLSNLAHWRGPVAKSVRRYLKLYSKGV